MRSTIAQVAAPEDSADCASQLFELRQGANELMDVDKHYQREEHALFPFLEQHGITGPSKVMWAKDDDIRALLKALNEATHKCQPVACDYKLVCDIFTQPALAAVEERDRKLVACRCE